MEHTPQAEEAAEAQSPALPEPAIPLGWLRALLGVIAYVTLMIGVGIVVAVIVGVTMAVRGEPVVESLEAFADPSRIGLIPLALLQALNVVMVVVVVWVLRRFVDRRSLVSLGLDPAGHGLHLVQGLIWGAAVIAFGFAVLTMTGSLVVVSEHEAIGFGPFLGYLLVLVLVAANEELFVRGYVLSNLMDSMNRYAALAVSALTFAVLHLLNANISLLSVVNLVLAGFVLGIYYVHRRNLWFSIGMHLTWNLFQGPVLGFEVSGIRTPSVVGHMAEGNDLLTGGSFGLEGSLLTTVFLILMTVVIHIQFRDGKRRDAAE